MENCMAPGLDKMRYIVRSCIVFSQSTLARKLGAFEMSHVQYLSWTDSIKSLLFSKCGNFISKGSLFQIILYVMVICISASKKMRVKFFQNKLYLQPR